MKLVVWALIFAAIVSHVHSSSIYEGEYEDAATEPQMQGVRGSSCKFDSVGSTLRPGGNYSYFERGEGICSGTWGFGLSSGGSLRLYDGSKVVWDAGKAGMDFCNMNRGGNLACYKGEPFKPEGGAIFAINCGGNAMSYMKINQSADPVVQKKDDVKSWGIEKDGDVVGTCVTSSTEAKPSLIARYDWKNGAKDVSGSTNQHNGRLDPGAKIKNGKIICKSDYGVNLGKMEELSGATFVKIQFKSVSYSGFPERCNGSSGQYSVLFGAGYEKWWVGIDHECPDDSTYSDEDWYQPNGRTLLVFNVGGFGHPDFEHKVVVANKIVTKFDSIEYRFEGARAPNKRLAIRFNGGNWVFGGWKDPDFFPSLPSSIEDARINDGARADWDPADFELGPVSIWSN